MLGRRPKSVIDPMVSLVFSMHSAKGAYALLLGSGVSRAAGIPTGWDIVLDLVRKVADLENEECGPDPAEWYLRRMGAEPKYDELLERLAHSSTERSLLLRQYFEPNGEERDQGLKLPTRAHKAIAGLVAQGWVRVILTTNFDRLMEQALEAAGVNPTVVASPSSAAGTLPLVHQRCLLVKVHGDYLDSEVKNTPEELATYHRSVNSLLDRIFDELGLVVCGWSADYDVALRRAIERCKNHRFTTYWAARSALAQSAAKLIELRRAELVRITDADSFFAELSEKATSIEQVDRSHPASPQLAVATLKRYLQDERRQIDLHDLVVGEAERVAGQLGEEHFPVERAGESIEELELRLHRYEALCETLVALFATGCHWSSAGQTESWVKAFDVVAATSFARQGSVALISLKRYPALLLLYVGALAAVSRENYPVLHGLFYQTRCREDSGWTVAAQALDPVQVMDTTVWQRMPGLARRHTPGSDYLFEKLRPYLRGCIPGEEQFQHVFDRFEYLHSLAQLDLNLQRRWQWTYRGCYLWRRVYPVEDSAGNRISKELGQEGEAWGPVRAGMFGGSIERARAANERLLEIMRASPVF
jgi:hypothetical protein